MIIGQAKASRGDSLFAFDIESEELVWAIDLQKLTSLSNLGQELMLEKAGEFIYLRFFNESKLFLIEPKTGKISSPVELPFVSKLLYPPHIDSSQLAYFIYDESFEERFLVGGKICDEQFKMKFKLKTPGG